MTVFCYKKLDATVRLGDRFRLQREALGLDIITASNRTHLATKYITAIEAGNFLQLPKARGYRLAYIREYATELGLPANDCLDQFSREDGLEDAQQIHPKRDIRWLPFSSISIFVRNIVFVGGALLFLGYLAWQIHGILQPPKLLVYSPLEGFVLGQPTTIVQGEAEKESRLTVNGQDVMVDEAGRFEAKIDLSTGVNTITIQATKKHGKTSTVVRHLVVKQPV